MPGRKRPLNGIKNERWEMIDTSAMGLIQVEEDVKILPPNIIITSFDKIINWGGCLQCGRPLSVSPAVR